MYFTQYNFTTLIVDECTKNNAPTPTPIPTSIRTKFSPFNIVEILLYIIIGLNIFFGMVTFLCTLIMMDSDENKFIWPFFASVSLSVMLTVVLIPTMYFTPYNFGSRPSNFLNSNLK